MKDNNLPIGLGFALAQNEDAMKKFESLPDSKKNEIIQKAENVTSKSEMQAVLRNLTTKW